MSRSKQAICARLAASASRLKSRRYGAVASGLLERWRVDGCIGWKDAVWEDEEGSEVIPVDVALEAAEKWEVELERGMVVILIDRQIVSTVSLFEL